MIAMSISAFADQIDYQKMLDRTGFHFQVNEASIMHSILRTPNEYTSRIEHVPAKYQLSYSIRKDDEERFKIEAHEHSVFRIHNDVLYYSLGHYSSSGCQIVAFDLGKKAELWKVSVKGIGPVLHSAYRNIVTLDVNDDVVTIHGHESFGDYIECLDIKTGKTVANRTYNMERMPGGLGKSLTGDELKGRIIIACHEESFTMKFFIRNEAKTSIKLIRGHGSGGIANVPGLHWAGYYITSPTYLRNFAHVHPEYVEVPAGQEVLYGSFTMGYPPEIDFAKDWKVFAGLNIHCETGKRNRYFSIRSQDLEINVEKERVKPVEEDAANKKLKQILLAGGRLLEKAKLHEPDKAWSFNADGTFSAVALTGRKSWALAGKWSEQADGGILLEGEESNALEPHRAYPPYRKVYDGAFLIDQASGEKVALELIKEEK